MQEHTVYHRLDTVEKYQAVINDVAKYKTHGTPLIVFDLNSLQILWEDPTLTDLGFNMALSTLENVFYVKRINPNLFSFIKSKK